MSEGERKKKAAFPSPLPLGRPEDPEKRRWPSPTPLPIVPREDAGKLLKEILNRLDAIEKRLEKIEIMLTTKRPL